VLLLLVAGALCTNGQAVNAASGSSTVAPGSLVSVYGNFTNSTGAAVSLPLPPSVFAFYFLLWSGHGAVSDTVANRVPLLYWSPSQINIVLPSAANGSVLVGRDNGLPDGSAALNVAAQAPGIFVNPASDCSLSVGCIQTNKRGILTDGNYDLVNSENPAHPRQALAIWCTGLGTAATTPEIVMSPGTGSVSAAVLYSGHTSFAGLDQVNFTIPQGSALTTPCSLGSRLEFQQLSMRSTTSGVQSNAVIVPVVVNSCN
jgi:uncharacterized protein (TIGR03437 family)